MGLALQIVLIGFIPIRSDAQNLTLPLPGPTPTAGAHINSLTISGQVSLGTINLTISPNFNPANTGITINSGGNLTADLMTVNGGGGLTGVRATATSPGVATAELMHTTINMANGGIAGLIADGSGATVTLATTSQIILSNGGGTVGALAQNGGIVNLSVSEVWVVNGGGNFPVIASSGGTVNLDDDVIGVSGGGGNTGLKAGTAAGDLILNQPQSDTVGHLFVTNSEVTVSASGAGFGVKATTLGSTATLQDTSVTVNAVNNSGGNFGVIATNSATATLANTNVTVNAGVGGGNAGILVTNSGKVGVTDGTVLVDSTGSDSGVQLGGQNTQFGTGGGTIEMTGGTVEKSGSNGQAILVSGTSLTGSVNEGTFDGTTVKSANIGILAQGTATSTLNFLNSTASVTSASTGILAQGSGTSTVNFENGASLNPGNNLLLNVTQDAFVNLNAITDVDFVGNIDARAANGPENADVALRNNSSLQGWINEDPTLIGASSVFSANTGLDGPGFVGLPRQNVNLLVDPSTWNMTASSVLNNLAVAPGARINLNFGESTSRATEAFRTLVAHSMTGFGGIFGMNVDLANLKGDLLVIQTLDSRFSPNRLLITNIDQSGDPGPNKALLVVITAQTRGPGGLSLG